jgi:hypothetical protein
MQRSRKGRCRGAEQKDAEERSRRSQRSSVRKYSDERSIWIAI